MSQSEDLELITERRKVYGDPEETFCRIAEVWSGILGVHVNPVDVPLCMAGMKLVRTQVCPSYSDNSDDITGYMDIFRLLVGDDMIEARSVQEYLEKMQHPLLVIHQETTEVHEHRAMPNSRMCTCGAMWDRTMAWGPTPDPPRQSHYSDYLVED